MRRFCGVFLALTIAAGATAAHAQNGPPAGARPAGPGAAPQQAGLTLRGTVKDAATGQPLTAAAIAVWSAADSTLVTGVVGRPDGTFRVEGLRPGAYYLKVSQLGYATGTVARVALTPATPVTDVGEVKLAAGAVALEGIQATAERAQVQTAVDRTVYNARDLPGAAGGNSTDVLRNVPGVEVDGDGKVSLRGNENVAIQINGRPAPLRGDGLTNFLKQLPAGMVERVEVIPNPSAKYDPEGMGGIINIVMKQNADLGLSGGVTLGAATGGRYNANGNLGYQSGPLTLFGSYGFFGDHRENSGFNRRENLQDAVTTGFLNQDITGEGGFRSHTFNGSADLKLGRQTSLSSSLMLSLRGGDVDNLNRFTALDAGRAVTSRFDQVTGLEMDHFTTDASLSFRHAFQPQKHELSAEARFNRGSDDIGNRFSTFPFASGVRAESPSQVRATDLDGGNRELSFQADYTRALTGTLKLETGYKGILRRIDNDFTDRVLVGEGDDDGDNAFTYDENVHAGYALLTNGFGRLSVQAGLRAEAVTTNFDLTTTGEAFDNDYTSLFPSAAATYQFDDQRQLRASYSRRVQRPDTRLLNPFPFAEDQFNRVQGNPRLLPEYTHSMELTYQQSTPWGSLQVSPFYRNTTDAVRRIKTVDPESGISTASFQNVATSESYGADLTSSLRLGRLTGFASVSGFRVVTDGSNVASGLGSDALSWNARASLTYKVTPTTELTWFQFYRGPMDVEQGRVSGFSMSNFSLRQKFWHDKGSLSLRLSDPFDQMGFTFHTFDALHEQESRRKFGARAAYLTFSYNFGQQPRIRQRPQQQPEQQAPPAEIGIN
ncbi:MAG TPA: TonB-dependent receptor [Longimicrobium sp.]|jgi:outer membrane receptor protein involved in Fe transport